MELLSEKTIKKIIQTINRPIDKTNIISIEDDKIRTLLEYYLFLTQYSHCITRELQIVSKNEMLYSRYYWFKRFVKEYYIKYGFDAGLEQQGFKLFEEIDRERDGEIDLELLESIEKEHHFE